MRRATLTCCVLVVLSPLAVTPAVGAAPAPVVARTATLTSHPPGFPQGSPAAARQIESAVIRVDTVASRVSATITLRDVPTAETGAQVVVSLGKASNGTCADDEQEPVDTVAPTDGASRSGRVISLDRANTFASVTAWDCAFVVVVPPGQDTPIYDVVLGDLTPVLGPAPQPVLSIGSVDVLEKPMSTLRLVRGVTTVLHVNGSNAPDAPDADGVFVSGSGKGLKVQTTAPLGFPVSDGSTFDIPVEVKLTGKKSVGPLTLVVHSDATTVVRTIRVKSVSAPPAPIAGTYRDRKKGVKFTIRRSKVVGFNSGSQQTRCGGFPDNFTYTRAFYDHPSVRIPRSGIVDDTDRGDRFTTKLQLKVVGGKVTQGRFDYFGPNRCYATVSFKAKRS